MRSLFILLLFSAGLAQASDDVSVRSLTFAGKNSRGEVAGPDEVKMPFVKMANAKIAAKINDQLFIGQFNVMAPEKPGSVIGAADHIDLASLSTQDFSVAMNSQRVLTIAFDGEGCGAYCEAYATYYSFDIRNGHLITADDLLTPSGMRALDARMKKERIGKYKQQLALLHAQLKASQSKRGVKIKVDIGDLNDRIAMNEDCLQQAGVPDGDSGMGPFAFNTIELADDAFRITRYRCSNHASHALDDVDDVTLAIAYKDMRPYLTSYGKALLLNEGDTMPADSPFGQLLRGHLGGNIAITMLLRKQLDNSVEGFYFYDKYRTPISVGGLVNGNELELNEADGNGTEGAKMKLTVSGAHVKGRWVGKKEFALELKP